MLIFLKREVNSFSDKLTLSYPSDIIKRKEFVVNTK